MDIECMLFSHCKQLKLPWVTLTYPEKPIWDVKKLTVMKKAQGMDWTWYYQIAAVYVERCLS